MNGSALTLTLAAGLAALAAARPQGRGSRAHDSIRLDPRRSGPTGHARPSETREAAEKRYFDALEAIAGAGQVLYIGPFVMVGDRAGGVYGNLEIGVSVMENGTYGVHLGFIGVPKESRRTGRGSTLLGLVTAAADAAGLPMDLDVDPTTMRGDAKAPVSKKDLRAWYGKFGFKSVKRLGIDYMARPAKGGASVGSPARKPAPSANRGSAARSAKPKAQTWPPPVPKNDADIFASIYRWTSGRCLEFAQALHERYGYPLVIITPAYNRDYAIHIVCAVPGGYVDALGFRTETNLRTFYASELAWDAKNDRKYGYDIPPEQETLLFRQLPLVEIEEIMDTEVRPSPQYLEPGTVLMVDEAAAIIAANPERYGVRT